MAFLGQLWGSSWPLLRDIWLSTLMISNMSLENWFECSKCVIMENWLPLVKLEQLWIVSFTIRTNISLFYIQKHSYMYAICLSTAKKSQKTQNFSPSNSWHLNEEIIEIIFLSSSLLWFKIILYCTFIWIGIRLLQTTWLITNILFMLIRYIEHLS